MQLNAILHGHPTDRPPLVIAHGLFGSARNWGVVARQLAAARQVIAVDMRNHGDSPRSPDHSYEAMAGDLADVIAAHGAPADLLGHSMGGKAAMMLALTEPDCIRRLIVADIAPVDYEHTQARYVRVMQSVDLAGITRRAQADPALAAEVPDASLRGFLLQSLTVGPAGAGWKLNLSALAQQMPKIMSFPETTATFDGPTLFLTGGGSDYVRPEHWARIRALFPNAQAEAIEGAAHWLHADAPAAFAAAVEAFLA